MRLFLEHSESAKLHLWRMIHIKIRIKYCGEYFSEEMETILN